MTKKVQLRSFAQAADEIDPRDSETGSSDLLSDQEREKLSQRYTLSYLKVLNGAINKLKGVQPTVAAHRRQVRQFSENTFQALDLMKRGFESNDNTKAVFLEGEKATHQDADPREEKVHSRFEMWKRSVTLLSSTWSKLLDSVDHQLDVSTKVLIKLKLPQFRLPDSLEAFYINSTKEVVRDHRFKRVQEARDIFLNTKFPLSETQQNALAEKMRNASYVANEVGALNRLFKRNYGINPLSAALEENKGFAKRVDEIVSTMLFDFTTNRVIQDGKIPAQNTDAALKQLRKACQEHRINAEMPVLEAYLDFAARSSRPLGEAIFNDLRHEEPRTAADRANIVLAGLIKMAQEMVAPPLHQTLAELENNLEEFVTPQKDQAAIQARDQKVDQLLSKLEQEMREAELPDGNGDLDGLRRALDSAKPNADVIKQHIENLKALSSTEEPSAPGKSAVELDNKTKKAVDLLIVSLEQHAKEIQKLIALLESTYTSPEVLPALTKLGKAWMDQTVGKENQHQWMTRAGDGEAVLSIFDKDTGIIKKVWDILTRFMNVTNQENRQLIHAIAEITGSKAGTEVEDTTDVDQAERTPVTVQDIKKQDPKQVTQLLNETDLSNMLLLLSALTTSQKREANGIAVNEQMDPEVRSAAHAIMERAIKAADELEGFKSILHKYNAAKATEQGRFKQSLQGQIQKLLGGARSDAKELELLHAKITGKDEALEVASESIVADAVAIEQVLSAILTKFSEPTAPTADQKTSAPEEAPTEPFTIKWPNIDHVSDMEALKTAVEYVQQQFTKFDLPANANVQSYANNVKLRLKTLLTSIGKVTIFIAVVDQLSALSTKTRDVKEIVTRFVTSQNEMKRVESELENVLSEARSLEEMYNGVEPFTTTEEIYESWQSMPQFLQKAVDHIREFSRPMQDKLSNVLQRVQRVYDTYLVNNKGRFTEDGSKTVMGLLNNLSILVAGATGFQGIADKEYHVAFYKLIQKRLPEIIEAVKHLKELHEQKALYKQPKSSKVASRYVRVFTAQVAEESMPNEQDEPVRPVAEQPTTKPKAKDDKVRDRAPAKLLELFQDLKSNIRSLIEANDEQVRGIFYNIERTLQQLQQKNPYGSFGIADPDQAKREDEMKRLMKHKEMDSADETELADSEIDAKLDQTYEALKQKYQKDGLTFDLRVIEGNGDVIEQIIARKPSAQPEAIADLYMTSIRHRISTMQGFARSQLQKLIKHYRDQEGSGAQDLAQQLEKLFDPSNKVGQKTLYEFVEKNLHDYNPNLLNKIVEELEGPRVQKLGFASQFHVVHQTIDESRLNRLMALCLNTES